MNFRKMITKFESQKKRNNKYEVENNDVPWIFVF
jgi:hypothetical protein